MHFRHRQTDGHWHRSISARCIITSRAKNVKVFFYICESSRFLVLRSPYRSCVRNIVTQSPNHRTSLSNRMPWPKKSPLSSETRRCCLQRLRLFSVQPAVRLMSASLSPTTVGPEHLDTPCWHKASNDWSPIKRKSTSDARRPSESFKHL